MEFSASGFAPAASTQLWQSPSFRIIDRFSRCAGLLKDNELLAASGDSFQTEGRMKKLFGLSFLPLNADLGLLLFRVVLSGLVLRFHGWGKLTGWKDESQHLPALFSLDGWRKEFHTFPNYIGLSSELSYLLVTWFETLGCMMIIAGLCTRLNALGMFVTLMVAWYFHHHMRLSGSNSGEVAFAYGFGFLLLFLAGGGKYSLDHKLGFERTSRMPDFS